MFDIVAAGLVVTAFLAYLNHRLLKLPLTIGVMAMALILSVALVVLQRFGFGAALEYEAHVLRSIDFSSLLMQGMLSMLLFAGALHVDFAGLRTFRWQIAVLAVCGTALSTALIGFALHAVLPYTGYSVPLAVCLAFGALISPTDPIAVMNMLRAARGPAELSTVIAGESLFNDGVGVVLFTVLAATAFADDAPSVGRAFYLFLREAGGGLCFGGMLGAGLRHVLMHTEGEHEKILFSLAGVIGGYALADHLSVSGPLAIVVAGISVGTSRHATGSSHQRQESLPLFWDLLDAVLNAILFVLMGLEAILISWQVSTITACAAAIAICLIARWLSVGAPVHLLIERFGLPRRSGLLLTWGGLRGGISVAMALSLPGGIYKNLLSSMTYSVVVVSILVQGLSFGRLARRCL